MTLNPANKHYRTQIASSLSEIGAAQWDGLLALQPQANPFLSYAFLHALHESGSACASTGWQPTYLALWEDLQLVAAMPLYQKSHSYGEYVFDWSWRMRISGTVLPTTRNYCQPFHLRRSAATAYWQKLARQD